MATNDELKYEDFGTGLKEEDQEMANEIEEKDLSAE